MNHHLCQTTASYRGGTLWSMHRCRSRHPRPDSIADGICLRQIHGHKMTFRRNSPKLPLLREALRLTPFLSEGSSREIEALVGRTPNAARERARK